ncbi:hypothetical protein CCUS01_02649 [Colletotrichum cuscutae]|uniref:protein S-acyltransferase n=1 Tax=Colletotrichum cuscutae TaxID=1209917 RepID=A0AAI9YDW9_9PEZI|nr:hypothetical protein CCUS01_02649 [Colletotrichum cuscutae]
MTQKLLVYLMRSSKIPSDRPSSDDLYLQAARWTTYARLAETAEDIAQIAADFLQNDESRQRWVYTSRLFEEEGKTDNYMTSSLAIKDLRRTALSCACGLGLRETAKVLISRGVDLEIPVEGNIAISACALSGLFDLAQLLLDRGVDINAVSEGCNPLQVAAGQNNHQMVKFLLARGADTKAQVNRSTTPLLEATDYLHIARTLLESGADPNLRGFTKHPWEDISRLPLSQASTRGQPEMVKLLLDYGADVNASTTEGTALLLAATGGHDNIARLLLGAGAQVDLCSLDDRSPLAEASMRGHTKVVRLLLDNHAVVDKQTRFGSALLAATHRRHTSVVRLLLEKGADYEVADNVQQSKSMAFEKTRFKYMNRPRNGEDPLTVASKLGHIEIAQLLLKHRRPSNRPATSWSRALATAIIRDHYHITEMFVEAGADLNAPVEEYGSLLNLALGKHRLKVAKLLWRNGADASIPCVVKIGVKAERMNAVQFARHLELNEIADLISKVPSTNGRKRRASNDLMY